MSLVARPRSLVGQIALLVSLALFMAQAINFALLLRERNAFRIEQSAGPAATRVIDALEREANGRPLYTDRGRVRRVATNPVPAGLPSRPEIADGLRQQLGEAGMSVGRIVTGVRPVRPEAPRARAADRWREARRLRVGGELLIGVEQPGRGWLFLTSPFPLSDSYLVWRLIGQTLILYIVVLIPVLWIARRIAHPLASLTRAAERFGPGAPVAAIAESGPSDVRTLIAAFNALQLRVTAMLDEKDRMLGAIGHDLRTPLAALRVRIESVEDETDRQRMADTIEEMSRTLDDILSLARLGRPSEPATDVDLAALVDAVVEDFRDIGDDVTLSEADRLRMTIRPSLMRRAVRNLIENAVKYGGGAEVAIIAGGHEVAITVADHGPGIPPDQVARVFDPFTRLETSRNRDTGGIGLGLALARAIVREAGGEIVLANRIEGGLVATIRLPRAR